MSIRGRTETLIGLVSGQVPEALDDVVRLCATFRANAEIRYGFDENPDAFLGKCYGETVALSNFLAPVFPQIETHLGEFHFTCYGREWRRKIRQGSGTRICGDWHVALVVRHNSEWWLCDTTADQFLVNDRRAPRLVFDRLDNLFGTYLPVPSQPRQWPAPWFSAEDVERGRAMAGDRNTLVGVIAAPVPA